MKQSTTSRTTDSANAGWLQRGVRRYVNRYTGQPFELLPDKHPRGGLYIYMKNLETGETATFHRGNLKTSFSPNDCVSDGPADAHKSTSSAEGPFAARNG